MIDTHSHIYDEAFDQDRDEMIQRAKDAGVRLIYLPNIDSCSIQPMLETESRYGDFCKAMMGLHPTSVKDDYLKELAVVEEWLGKREFAGVGEIGMDLYWDTTYRKEQEEALAVQLKWAAEFNLPVVIHTRNAFPDIFKVFEKVYDPRLRGVFHSFSGTVDDAHKILSMPGFYIGINGVVTFKKSNLPEILMSTGHQRLLLETDAPYLSPVPYRGKRNEPAYMVKTLSRLSDILGIPTGELNRVTTENAEYLFENR